MLYNRYWHSLYSLGFILILLIFGGIVLITGYLVPKMNIDVGYQEEMRIIDRAMRSIKPKVM
jgi:hypothetical protein